jgi:protein-tyrosine-phosphatase
MTDRKFNVLFICTGNSARSIFAESILRDIAGDRFVAYSAGTKPSSDLNPFALEVLKRNGHDVSVLRSKNVAEFQGRTLPDSTSSSPSAIAPRTRNARPGPDSPISGHWGLPDPAQAEGTEAERALAFQNVYGALRNRIQAFVGPAARSRSTAMSCRRRSMTSVRWMKERADDRLCRQRVGPHRQAGAEAAA